ncbi:hypothetical protein AHF37_10247 [Paragonimus kellicotti]|nr:hypothetical protein AHF37_10247 [Paragonimus kellicotti]
MSAYAALLQCKPKKIDCHRAHSAGLRRPTMRSFLIWAAKSAVFLVPGPSWTFADLSLAASLDCVDFPQSCLLRPRR